MNKFILAFFLFNSVLSINGNNFSNKKNKPYIIDNGHTLYSLVNKDSDCPLIVTNADIVFNIDFGADFNSSSSLQTLYTFTNPCDYDITTKLLLPFEHFDENFKCDIKINDQKIDKTLRASFYENEGFNFERDFNKLNDDYIVDDIYNSELKVFKYTLEADSNLTNQLLEFSYNPQNYKPIFQEIMFMCEFVDENCVNISINLNENNLIFDMYLIGNDDFDLKNKFLIDDNAANISIIKKEELDFKNWILSNYDVNFGISLIDYYNAILYKFKDDLAFSNAYSHTYNYYFDTLDELMYYYEYDLDVAKNSSVTNEIIANICPSINTNYSPNTYTYSYCFLKSMMKYDTALNIAINTPLYLISSSFANYVGEENKYSLSINTDANEKIDFTLCEELYPTINNFSDTFWKILSILIILFFVASISIPLIILIVQYVKCRKINKDNINNTKQNNMHFLQGIVAIFTYAPMFISFLSFLSYSIIAIILELVAMVIYIGLLIYEIVKYRQKIVGRLIVVILSLLIISNIEMVDINYFFLTILGIILVCIEIFKINELSKRNSNNVNANNYNKYLPVGFTSKKVLLIFIILFALLFIGAITLIVCENLPLVISLIIGFLLIFIMFVGVIIVTQVEFKEFRAYAKTLDYDTLEKNVLLRIENPKINPEYRNYILMQLAVIALGHSFERYCELRKMIFVPSNKYPNYRMTYDGLNVNYLLYEEELNQKCDEIILKYRQNAVFCRNVEKFRMKWNAYFRGELKGNIDRILPIKTKNNQINGFNLFIRINYYQKNGDYDKAFQYKNEFLQKYYKLSLLVNELNGEDIRRQAHDYATNFNKCPHCQESINNDDIYCRHCGQKLK